MRKLFILILICCFCFGCSALGQVVSPTQSFSKQEKIALPATQKDVLQTSSEVGKGMGYYIRGMTSDGIVLEKRGNMGTHVLVGKVCVSQLRIKKAAENKLDVSVEMAGNFNTSNETEASKIFAEFQQKLLASL